MKRLLPLLLFFTLLLPLSIYAQEGITDITHIEVALWPDFDDASLLVLVTGSMPEDGNLPADITFPLPDGYNRLVVARVTDDGNMIDDIETLETASSVTFSLPESRFRIEYYIPYTANDDQREFDFSWQSQNLNVDTFQVTVQRPAAATELNIEPTSVGEVVGASTGLTEYLLSEIPLPANTAYDVAVNYAVNSRLLSVDLISDSAPLAENNTAPPPAPEPSAENNNTLIITFGIIGVLLIAVAVGWYIYSSHQNGKPPQKPKPTRSMKRRGNASKFCHECGTLLTTGAKFCASCGTAVKK